MRLATNRLMDVKRIFYVSYSSRLLTLTPLLTTSSVAVERHTHSSIFNTCKYSGAALIWCSHTWLFGALEHTNGRVCTQMP